jgi:hypothetical protein
MTFRASVSLRSGRPIFMREGGKFSIGAIADEELKGRAGLNTRQTTVGSSAVSVISIVALISISR